MTAITLRQARLDAGLTQEQLEQKSGVNQASISAIERGMVANPAWNTVTKLAAALDLDVRCLRFGARDVAQEPAP